MRGTHQDVYEIYKYGKPNFSGDAQLSPEGGGGGGYYDFEGEKKWLEEHPYHQYIYDEDLGSGEDASHHNIQKHVEWDKLPNQGVTKFGRIGEEAVRVNSPKDLNNADMLYFDPAYGWVTHKSNIKKADKNIIGKIGSNGPLMASLAMGGLMGVALPAGMVASGVKTAFNTAPALAKGDYKAAAAGLVGGALGAGAQGMGVPSWVVPAAKTAYGVAKKGISTDSLINAGLGYGAGQLGLPSWVVPTATSLGRMYTSGRK
jgi:hypothetical protein